MALKRQKGARIEIRLSQYEKNKLQYLADRYAAGNLSAWILYASFNVPRKVLKKKNSVSRG